MTDQDVIDRVGNVMQLIRGAATEVDRDGTFPTEQVAALADAGLLGLLLPETVGGLGGGPRDLVEAMMTVAAACGSTAMVYLMHLSAAVVTAAAPPDDGGHQLLADLASGTKLGTLAFSEKGSRSHFWAPISRASRTSAGSVTIGADKSWVTSATTADVYVASCLAAESEGPTETNLYVVDRSADGVNVLGSFDGIGLRGNDSAPVRLDVQVEDGARLGDEKAGLRLDDAGGPAVVQPRQLRSVARIGPGRARGRDHPRVGRAARASRFEPV